MKPVINDQREPRIDREVTSKNISSSIFKTALWLTVRVRGNEMSSSIKPAEERSARESNYGQTDANTGPTIAVARAARTWICCEPAQVEVLACRVVAPGEALLRVPSLGQLASVISTRPSIHMWVIASGAEEAHAEFVEHFGREVCGRRFASRSHDHDQLDASKIQEGSPLQLLLYPAEKTIANTNAPWGSN